VLGEDAFGVWGWRVPFIGSIVLLGVSVWIRLQLHESPVFARMKAEGKTSKAPLTEAFGHWKNLKLVLLALAASAGEAVVWYTGQFYALFFLTQTLKVEGTIANILVAIALVIGTPFFVLFGSLSDRIGRKPIIMAGFAQLLPALQSISALREPGPRNRHPKLTDRSERESERVLVPVQPGWHREVQ
jgi:MFS family permease